MRLLAFIVPILFSLPAFGQGASICWLAYDAKMQYCAAQFEDCDDGPYNPVTGEPCPDWPECCEWERAECESQAYTELLNCLGITATPGEVYAVRGRELEHISTFLGAP